MQSLYKTVAATVLLFIASACSHTNEQIRLISSQGIDDAIRLAQLAPTLTPMALECELLEIRAREYDYRTQIGDAEADAYIEAFESNLREINDSLADILFAPIQPNPDTDNEF
ncbi:MAG: hypothetical protein NC343_07140 [Muribaculum sp.]|nr:hypothetical protein [Muribaculum sp.]